MRIRIVLLTIAVAAAAMLVLGIPLAAVSAGTVYDDARARLDRQAVFLASAIDLGSDDPLAPVAALLPDTWYVVLLDDDGRPVHELGDPLTASQISATAPLGRGWTMRVDEPVSDFRGRAVQRVVLVGALGLAGVATAAALSWVLAGRLTRPLSALAGVSERLGTGDFSARADRSGLPEVDALAEALERSGERLAAMVRSEREFSANASHQLRTPLTAVRVRLESISMADDLGEVREDAAEALDQADRLEATIKDLLALARTGHVSPPGPLALRDVVRARAMVWRPALSAMSRRLVLDVDADAVAVASAGGVSQVLDVLVENAQQHGSGTVRIAGRRRGEYVELRVSDEGSGVADGMERAVFERHVTGGVGSGVGLHLARTLAQADGGRLDLERPRPPVFTLRLPAAR